MEQQVLSHNMNKHTIRQFIIFCIIGGINTLVDLGVFNLLSKVFGLETTGNYVAWKSLGFIAAAVNSYFMNRYITFGNQVNQEDGKTFYRFAAVTVATFIISTGITSLLFSILTDRLDASTILIGNICAITGVAINVVCNFLGYKIFVFK